MVKKLSKIDKDKICSRCKETKPYRDYYAASNTIINSDGYLPICKSCLKELADSFDIETAKDLLRMIDKPFLLDIYEEKQDLVQYMIAINNKHRKNMTYKDSDFTSDNEEEFESDNSIKSKVSHTLSELRDFWGQYEKPDLYRLQDIYDNYRPTFDSSNPALRDIYKSIATVTLNSEKATNDGDHKLFTTMQKMLRDLRKEANAVGSGDEKEVNILGNTIKEIENYEPAEFFDKRRAKYSDYDGFGKYFKMIFARSDKNTFNDERNFDLEGLTSEPTPPISDGESR